MTNQTSSDIENGSPYANLVQQSDFANGDNWYEGTGCTISGGKAIWTSAPSGSGFTGNNLNAAICTVGKTYKVTFTIDSISEGALKIRKPFNSSVEYTSAGTYTETAVAAETDIYIQNQGTTTSTIDNVTVEEVNTGLQGYWKMGDGTNDEYPVIYDQTNPTLSAELVTNGDFATDSNWSFSLVSFSAGAITFNSNGSSAFQNLSFTEGKVYQIAITSTGVGTLRYRTGFTGTDGTTVNFPTSNVAYFTATSNSNRIQVRGDLSDTTMVLHSVSVKQVQGNPATMTNMVEGNITNQYPLTKIRNYYRMGDGILDGYPIIQDQTSPNLAHIPTTNLITYSEDFSNSYWDKDRVTVVSGQQSPSGDTSAYKLVEDTSVGAHRLRASFPPIHVSAGITNTYSIHVKAAERTKVAIREEQHAGKYVVFNLTTKTVMSNTGITANIITLNNDWLRIDYSQNSGGSLEVFSFFLLNDSYTSGSPSSYTYTGDGTSGVFIYGAQLEEQSQATPYLKSDGIAAVRKSSTTNLIDYSEDFTQSSWNLDGNNIYITRTPNAAISPSGNNDATKLITNNISKSPTYAYIGNSGLSATEPYTISVFAKKGEYDYLVLGNGGYGTGFYSVFNLSSGVISTQPSASSTFANIEDYSNGWYRCSVVTNNTSSGEMLYITPSVDGTITTNYTGTANGIYVWGAQAEEQTQAETYAKTTGLPVTIDLFTENNYGTMTNMSASDIVEDTPNN